MAYKKNDPEYYRNWYLKNRERVRATRRLYYLRNQEVIKAKARDYQRRKRAAEKSNVDSPGVESAEQVSVPVHTLSGTSGLSTSHRPEVSDNGSRSGE